MMIKFKYAGQSGIVSGLRSSRVAFATNTLREAAFLRGRLARPLVLRDGLAALYDLTVSDLKYRPRDRVEFRLWLERQDRLFLQSLGIKSTEIRQQIDEKEARLGELEGRRQQQLKPFYAARRKYFDYVYENQYELKHILDPIITVHPDEIAFESFSKDESSYGRLAAKFDLFAEINEFECGTTNVNFSPRLQRQLDRMRSYRDTRFDIDASGFAVGNTIDGVAKEKRIELPDSWLSGFLQVHSVMTLGLQRVRLSPVDLFNLCRFLRRFRAKASPRSLRWELKPGAPSSVVFEPWEHRIPLSPISRFEGAKATTIRTWGRDRLRVLERILPVVRHVDVYLAGHGLPSIYVCDLGDLTFTLGLSGWTDQDWTGESRFALLARRLDASPDELSICYEALRKARFAGDHDLAQSTGLGVEKTRSALSFLCQAGRAMFDLGGKVYRHRDLLFEPFDAKKALARANALAEESDPRAKSAREIFEAGNARLTARRPVGSGYKLSGTAKGNDGERVRPLLSVDTGGQILEATCTCKHFRTHRLTKGPCEHVLALRLAHMARLESEDKGN